MRKIFLVLALAATLSGCAGAGLTGGPNSGGAFCDVEQPTRLTSQTIDAMSHDELVQAVSHNEYGAKHCGWKK